MPPTGKRRAFPQFDRSDNEIIKERKRKMNFVDRARGGLGALKGCGQQQARALGISSK